ncbi:ankyrin repeat domain-containing protein 7-like [Columba livia]|uniref:ankyrin repeat domain-containing protein 7-like n=1 Tax=Columba livia TaxID=8932 RepID=UPI0031BAF401
MHLISRTPLHLACANGHADVVRFLAGKKCKLNPRGMFKKTPLMLVRGIKQACCSRWGRGTCCLIFEDARTFPCCKDAGVLTERNVPVGSYSFPVACFQAVQHQHKDCALALLEHGANPDHKGAGGNTALHLAAIMPSKSMVELLLEHNAHIDAQNDLGYTPLTVAVIKHREEMVEFLLQKGADANARDKRQRTILKIAVYAGNANAARLLLQHGAILSHRKDDFTYIGHLGHSTSE